MCVCTTTHSDRWRAYKKSPYIHVDGTQLTTNTSIQMVDILVIHSIGSLLRWLSFFFLPLFLHAVVAVVVNVDVFFFFVLLLESESAFVEWKIFTHIHTHTYVSMPHTSVVVFSGVMNGADARGGGYMENIQLKLFWHFFISYSWVRSLFLWSKTCHSFAFELRKLNKEKIIYSTSRRVQTLRMQILIRDSWVFTRILFQTHLIPKTKVYCSMWNFFHKIFFISLQLIN